MENDPIYQTLVLFRIDKITVHEAYNKIKNEVNLAKPICDYCNKEMDLIYCCNNHKCSTFEG